MDFEQILHGVKPRDDGDGWIAWIPQDWLQGRSAYGGLQAALALQAMRALVPAIPLRGLQVTFVAPVPPGAVQVRAQVLRSGKTTTQVEARLMEGNQTLCLAVGLFGVTRASKIRVRPAAPTYLADPARPPPPSAALPVCMQHFDHRWVRGALPDSGASSPDAMIQIGLKVASHTSELHLVALADAPPPMARALLTEPAPGSSMNWMLDFLAESYDHLPMQDWRFDIHISSAADGYTHQTATIWAPDGSPAMLSRQIMAVFG